MKFRDVQCRRSVLRFLHRGAKLYTSVAPIISRILLLKCLYSRIGLPLVSGWKSVFLRILYLVVAVSVGVNSVVLRNVCKRSTPTFPTSWEPVLLWFRRLTTCY